MSEIDAIRERHSVRTYDPVKIEKGKIEKILGKIDEINKEGNLSFKFLEDAGNTYNRLTNKVLGLGSAPSVIICAGKENTKDPLEERVGYYGEKLVLFIQELGLNTCWTGIFNKEEVSKHVDKDDHLVLCIAVGYGQTQGKPHKSKRPDQVTSGKGEKPYWFNKGVEMALLAPTAMNQQRFEIRYNEDGSVTFIDKGGPFSKVDLGIVRYHFEIGKTEK